MKKTFKMAIALIAIFSIYPRNIKAASNIDSLAAKIEYSKKGTDQLEAKAALKELISIGDEATINALFSNIENYKINSINKGPYEENLKAKLAVIDSIWALGEIGNPIIIKRLVKLYATSDEVLKVNIIISIGKTKSPEAIKILKNIANSKEAESIRATAWEMIDYITVDEEQWGF